MANLIPIRDSGGILGQRVASAVVKAGLSSIPFAVLAWDVAAAGLEFFNDRSTETFLNELGEQVASIEGHSGTLSGPAQTAAHESLQRLMQEDCEDYARQLAQSIIAIELSDEDPRLLRQFAAALAQMNSRFLIYLGTIYRIQNETLTAHELKVVREVPPFPPGTFGSGDSYDVLHMLLISFRTSSPLGLDRRRLSCNAGGRGNSATQRAYGHRR